MEEKKYFEILKETREEKGISLNEVYETLRIRPIFIEKVEEGDLKFQHISYVRAFVKSYADFLGLDSAEILSNFDKYSVESNVKTESVPDQFQVTEKKKVTEPDEDGEDSVIRNKGILRVVFFIVLLGLIIIISQVWLKEDDPTTSLLDQKSTEQQPVAESSKITEDKPVAAENKVEKKQQEHPLTLVVRCVETTWMKVKKDARDSVELTLRKGESVSYTAMDSFNMKIGLARGVLLYLNEKSLGSLGSGDDIVWELTVGREGIIHKRLTRPRKRSQEAPADSVSGIQ